MATLAIGISKGPGGYTCKVPVASLSESGVPPEQGDTVDYSVSGTVQSVSGNTATIKIDAINGEPVAEEGTESAADEAAEPETGNESASAMGNRLKKASIGLPMPS